MEDYESFLLEQEKAIAERITTLEKRLASEKAIKGSNVNSIEEC